MDIVGSNSKWNTDAMRELTEKWTLADDVALLHYLESFSQNILNKAHCTLKSLENFETTLNGTCIDMRTASNRFQALADTQFVENRVYEEEDNNNLDLSKKDDLYSRDETLNEKIEETIFSCIHLLDTKFESVQFSGSDSEDETSKDQLILKPINRYRDRPLPYLIGSEEFMKDDSLGLLPQTSGDSEDDDDTDESSSGGASTESFKDDEEGGVKLAHQLSKKLQNMEDSSNHMNSAATMSEDEGSSIDQAIIPKPSYLPKVELSSNKLQYAYVEPSNLVAGDNYYEDQNILESSHSNVNSHGSTLGSLKHGKIDDHSDSTFSGNIDIFGKDAPIIKKTNETEYLREALSNKGPRNRKKVIITKESGIVDEKEDQFSAHFLSSTNKDINKQSANMDGSHKEKNKVIVESIKESEAVVDTNLPKNEEVVQPIKETKTVVDKILPKEIIFKGLNEPKSNSIFDDYDSENDLFNIDNPIQNNSKSNESECSEDENNLFEEEVQSVNKMKKISDTDLSKRVSTEPNKNLFEEEVDLFSDLSLPNIKHSDFSLFSGDEDDEMFSTNSRLVEAKAKTHLDLKHPLPEIDIFKEQLPKIDKHERKYMILDNDSLISSTDLKNQKPAQSERNHEEKLESWQKENRNNDPQGLVNSDTLDKKRSANSEIDDLQKLKISNINTYLNDQEKRKDTENMKNDSVSKEVSEPTEENLFPGKLTSERLSGLTFINSSHLLPPLYNITSSTKNMSLNIGEIVLENGLPPLLTTTLDNLVKDRPKIQMKRRLPSRKTKEKSLFPNDILTIKPTVLSPSTDEEDMFVIPQLDIQKEKSSYNLFDGNALLSPGTSFDINIEDDSNPPFKKSINEEEAGFCQQSDPLEAGFDSNPSHTKKINQEITDYVVTSNECGPSPQLSKESKIDIKFDTNIFGSDEEDDDDLFTNKSSLNKSARASQQFIDNNLNFSKSTQDEFKNIKKKRNIFETNQTKDLSLFHDSCDDDDVLFTGMKSNYSKNSLVDNNTVHTRIEESKIRLVAQSSKMNQLEKKAVVVDPLMASNEQNIEE